MVEVSGNSGELPPEAASELSDRLGTLPMRKCISDNECPVCGGTDLARENRGDDIFVKMECENCGSTWLNDYELVGYSCVVKGPGVPA